MKNFGEFFNDQISNAGCIVFSHTDKTTDSKLAEALSLVREKNNSATIITTPYDKLDINDIVDSMEKKNTLKSHIDELMQQEECPICGHHHEHHHHHDCEHEHHHDCEHEHHHDCEHEHHHDCEHEHHHDCEHEHHHHHHHHADDVFTSWGRETVKKYTAEDISFVLKELENSEKYGLILRAKGMVEAPDGSWIYFDYVPEEPDIREGSPSSIGKLCVIGAGIKDSAIAELFGV